MTPENQKNQTDEKKLFKNEYSDEASVAQELEACKVAQELEACKVAQAEWKDKCMRATADLINFKNRMEKEQATWSHAARISILRPLLEIVDNFDRALATDEKVSEGVSMIHNSFIELLKKFGVQEVSYESFDPNLHEALVHVESPDHTEGGIVEVMQKGYMLNDSVLRPAKVSVAK